MHIFRVIELADLDLVTLYLSIFFSGWPITQHRGQHANVRGVPRPRVGARSQVLDGEQGRHAAGNTQIFPIHLRR